MFGFVKSSARAPLADVKAAERWLASLAPADVLAVQAELVREVARVAQPDDDLKPSQIEALCQADAWAHDLRRTLASQYIAHATRSDRIEGQLWQALFELTQAFLAAFGRAEAHALLHAQDTRWAALLPEIMLRALTQQAFDARIRMFRYEQWIPGKWAELHQRFREARARKLEHQRLMPAGETGQVTIEQRYITVLVLHLCNAGNVDRPQLQWLAGQLDEWCSALRLTVSSPGPTAFYVDLAQRHGLHRRSATPLQGQVLFLDTEPLHAILQHHVLVVEQKIRNQPLSPKTPRRIEQLSFLTKLATQVDPAYRPVVRRGERMAAVGKVDAIVGLPNIAAYLREEERLPVLEADTIGTFRGTLDLATFGHARNQEKQREELTRRRLASYCTVGGPWDMRDVSLTGLRLVAPMSAAGTVTLGMLVALRAHGEVVWKLGLVRRIRRLSAEQAEVGLQRIADSITAVDLRAQRSDADGEGEVEYAVDGESTARHDRAFRALFLALQQREGGGVIQSLVMPSSDYRAGRRFRLQTAEASYPIRFGRLIEEQPDWVWVAVEPLPTTATRTGVAPLPQ